MYFTVISISFLHFPAVIIKKSYEIQDFKIPATQGYATSVLYRTQNISNVAAFLLFAKFSIIIRK